jgi:rhodanese-related sulfurtransferase
MNQLSVSSLADWLADPARPRPLLLDVRQPEELAICALPDVVAMPMATVPVRADELPRDEEIVVICHHGGRSMQVAMFLENQGFKRVHNLVGGIDAWSRTVDPAVPLY